MNNYHLLSTSFTPVVLISACGLITPSLYSRLGEILARIRTFHHQKIELLKKLHEHDVDEQQMLLEMLDTQICQVSEKAKMIKKSLYYFLAAIAAFLLCSVLIGISEIHDWIGLGAWGMGMMGIFLFLLGLGWAMWELSLSLTPLEEESAHLKIVTAHYLAKAQRNQRLKVAESA